MLVGAQGRWNPNSINFISERQRGQVHIKLECSQSSAGAFIQPGPLQFRRREHQAAFGGWVGAEAGLEASLSYTVEEGVEESHSNGFNRNSSVPQSEYEISANIRLLS